MKTHSEVTCPECGGTARENMPTDACVRFYKCTHCGSMLVPKAVECCVFCSYGSARCPPQQMESKR
jgi:hypothetical protein